MSVTAIHRSRFVGFGFSDRPSSVADTSPQSSFWKELHHESSHQVSTTGTALDPVTECLLIRCFVRYLKDMIRGMLVGTKKVQRYVSLRRHSLPLGTVRVSSRYGTIGYGPVGVPQRYSLLGMESFILLENRLFGCSSFSRLSLSAKLYVLKSTRWFSLFDMAFGSVIFRFANASASFRS